MSRSPFLSHLGKSAAISSKLQSPSQFGHFLSPGRRTRTATPPLQNPLPPSPLLYKQVGQLLSPGKRSLTVTPPLRSPAYRNLQHVDSPLIKEFARNTEVQTNVTAKLGQGRFGLVVAGIYKGMIAAVKIAGPVGQANLETLYESESHALNLSHPSIIRTFKVEKLSKKVVVIMELYGQCNLQQYLGKNSIIELQEKLDIATQLASALRYCHENQILHLDVKPANVMVSSRCGYVKLGDFGNSQRVSCTARKLNSVGTIPYCAPEILRGERVTWHCDVFSYGITLWQLETRLNPYEGRDLTSVAYLVVSQGMRPAVLEPDSPFACIYTKCWSSQRQNRPSMQNILDTLKVINLEK